MVCRFHSGITRTKRARILLLVVLEMCIVRELVSKILKTILVGTILVVGAIDVAYLISQVSPLLFQLLGGEHLVVATWLMALFTTILSIFAIIQGIATWNHLKAFRQTQTWDRLRTHSEKLIPPLKQWIELSNVQAGEAHLEHANVTLSYIWNPGGREGNALEYHVRTGQKRAWREWVDLSKDFNEHQERSLSFFRKLEALVKQRVHLPSWCGKGEKPNEWFNSLRCAEIVYKSLFSEADADYYLKKNGPKVSEDRLHTMSWPQGQEIAMTRSMTECQKIQQAVSNLIAEPTIVQEAEELAERRKDIKTRQQLFTLSRLNKWLGIIELGGVLRGQCEYCWDLHL